MRISRFGALCVATAAAVVHCAALDAAVIQPYSIDELSIKSDRIVLGTVLDVQSRWNADRTLITSTVHVQAAAMLKGDARAIETIELIGGTVDGITLRLTDTPMFDAGDGVVLFINSDDRLVGTYQGAYFTDGRLAAGAEPAERSVSRSNMMLLRDLADTVALALGSRPLEDEQLMMPGVGLPNAGRYTLAGYSWAYQDRPMGEKYLITANGSDPAMGEHEGWQIAGVFMGALGWWDRVYANFKFYIDAVPSYTEHTAFDNKNVVFFCPLGSCGMDPATIATTYIWSEGADILEWDIVFNDRYHKFWTGLQCVVPGFNIYCPCPAGHYNIEAVAAHEFGHALGLGHSDDIWATMYPVIHHCEIHQALANDDDRAGVIEIYGAIQNEPFEFAGQYDGDTYGVSSGNAGDLDGDGVSDLIAGAPYNDDEGSDTGRVYVYSGKTGVLSRIIDGASDYDRFGWSVTNGGDVNRDGKDDFIVGAPYASRLRGRVYVYSGATGSIIHEFVGRDRHNDRFGWSVAGNVDVNRDGYADIIVGVPYGDNHYETNCGKVEVFSGRTGQRLVEIFGEERGDLFGWSVAGVGRINSDDHDDFLVGAPYNGDAGKRSGKAYLFSGRHLALIYSIKGFQKGSRFGYRVAGLGRVDSDARDDFVVASPYYDRDGADQSGRIDVFSGRYGQRIFSKKGEQVSDRLGWSVAAVGDYDGDGSADVITGAPKHSSINDKQGRAYIRSGLNGNTILQLDGEFEGDQFGYVVGALGDVDEDDIPDVVVSAPYSDVRREGSGKTYIYRSTELRIDRSAAAETTESQPAASQNGEMRSPSAGEHSRLRQLLTAWMDGGLLADLNDDGEVDHEDLTLIISGH